MKKYYFFSILLLPLLIFLFTGCNRTKKVLNNNAVTDINLTNDTSTIPGEANDRSSNESVDTQPNETTNTIPTDPADVDVNATLNELNTLKSQADSSQKSLGEADNVDESLNNTTSKVE
ncbi:MAG: hypothetical protein A3B74_01765 [Candidatus Kerfeldbacteria bacterium RIFCSPHIGHO2_02_FULL_42_14]|uniref:Lipoprotein n=1 Tax=Candidatus Kerfeldbacteria bacterium RIFCSPHIGHO2_02_FULL_42_14 TaxID=1798540 RepID=A0A1G2AS56_9BACT|nr:MAG: hypothetical protein A3B74_01765 [Candidatus Kerfeldbacteria bacterium RIFCSPHIGHO2_02_FULL_42_14]OGY82715.1 MAG: hypothetical protein A3I91_00985 [Candidatus Kerfeldbacteria bacterium RIFCSPLOWO2_02_FULL_42_19]OGY86077.1 MAG: hypothetical protein A3G01_03180 [Candidatus Kerfeldbacteria bacterium RIFCSPLOWO2_12_FULL_43_9]